MAVTRQMRAYRMRAVELECRHKRTRCRALYEVYRTTSLNLIGDMDIAFFA
jgi:hypothetical protein